MVGVAAVLVAGTVSAAALWQRHERQRLAAVTARLDAAVTALERERRPLPPVRDVDAERRARASDPGRPQSPFVYRLPRRGS